MMFTDKSLIINTIPSITKKIIDNFDIMTLNHFIVCVCVCVCVRVCVCVYGKWTAYIQHFHRPKGHQSTLHFASH